MLVDEKFIREKYIGIPFKHHGRTMAGLDCWGLLILIFADLGFRLIDIEEDYDNRWSWEGKNLFIENYHKEWVRVEQPKLFDVVLFSNSKDIASHAGMHLSERFVIHTCRAGTVVSKISDIERKHKLAGYFRLKVMQ